VGGRTILDVLNARQELLNAQVAVVHRATHRNDRRLSAFVGDGQAHREIARAGSKIL